MKNPAKLSTRKSFGRQSKLRPTSKAGNGKRGNKDQPTKQDVEADQELDNVTWADR
jgi:hypothetical protein